MRPHDRHQHIPSTSTNLQKTQHRSIFAHRTWVTFSVTLWVRSISLHGAMMSISPVGRAMSGSGLKSTKFKVIWGIFEIARYRIRSESDVEFKIFDLLLTAPVEVDRKKKDPIIFTHRILTLLSPLCYVPVLLLPCRMLVLRFFRSQSGLMASISSTEEARRMLWMLSRDRLCDKEQFEPEPSRLRLRWWWGATQGDDWVWGPTRCVLCGGGGGAARLAFSKVHWSSWRSSGQSCRPDLSCKIWINNYHFGSD